ncbi:MAG: selenide, water dikinase SelD [Chloroflexi bacterium]|nr:selenide, water dikinase SelD [Ardenticatenaceae bacterium]MBL1129162.1 selenide, water dikinase SelD [Chloroflexota bacterium]NOG35237.1 selenide, water dikinase SelD [Chloroflexota bacterium]
MGPGDLAHVLEPLRDIFKPEDYPDLLVGLDRADDAAVYRLNDQQAIVTTTDFFPPVVDDPYDFGAIAAANALSDIYAMGGKVLFAINLVAFPDDLDKSILREILRGGAEKVAEAGGVIAGGHSVTDKEPKYGLAVTGLVDPAQVKTKGGAQPGDLLLLTKPLGVGVVTTALKRGIARTEDVATAVTSMKTLNKQAAAAAHKAQAHAMTDITGFGLLGHAHEMAHLGQVGFRFFLDSLLWLPGAVQYGEAGAFPGGMARNLDYFGQWVTFVDDIPLLMQDMLWTPETSGGLLTAVPPTHVDAFRQLCDTAVIIGDVIPGNGEIIVIGNQ